MQASQRLREAIFATIQKTANDLEAQRQATEFSYRKRIHETEQTKNELEWQQKNVSFVLMIYQSDSPVSGSTVSQSVG
jgi:tektin-2